MSTKKIPSCVLLLSGKRKSGKDYFAEQLLKLCDTNEFVVIKISGPIKMHFAKNFNLDFNELISSGEYKERYRKQMILWSDEMRMNDPGIFCRAALEMYNAYCKSIWIVSDVRRNTDINWFKENFGDAVKTIRIEASEDARKLRGWSFVPGVDDVASECDLDEYNNWDWKFTNNGDENLLKESVQMIYQVLKKEIDHSKMDNLTLS